MSAQLHSIRMHASFKGSHLSGGERLIHTVALEDAVSELLSRALHHPRGQADKISLTVDVVPESQIRKETLLPISTHCVADWLHGRKLAINLLEGHGLHSTVVKQAVAQLSEGPGPDGGVMRGAMLVDAFTGQRLESDAQRGVRVSWMDLAPEFSAEVYRFLRRLKLENSRVIEAWILASKVALYPEVIAEICWSDDPDYVTGYVASSRNGYQRISHMKSAGDMNGGRIFFVQPAPSLDGLIDKLQAEPILFSLPSINEDEHAAD